MKLPRLAALLALALSSAACDHAARPATIARLEGGGGAASARGDAAAWRTYLGAQRKAQIERLRAYAAAGSFALNDRGAPGLQFIWRDPDGRLCAMAHLVAASGRADLVDAVAREQNDLQLVTLTEGPVFEWMLRSGLTKEEIQLVQEPGFQIEGREQAAWEIERKRQHLAAAIQLLERQSEASLEVAVARLGARAEEAPPA